MILVASFKFRLSYFNSYQFAHWPITTLTSLIFNLNLKLIQVTSKVPWPYKLNIVRV